MTVLGTKPPVIRRLTCGQCGAGFDCGPAGHCWCATEPVRLPLPKPGSGADCLCPACLRAAAASIR